MAPAPKNGGKASFQVGGDDHSDEDKSQSGAAASHEQDHEHGNGSKGSSFKRDAGLKMPHFTRLDGEAEDEDDAVRWERYKSGPTTPNIAQTAQQLRRSLSVSGLAELANGPNGGIKRKLWRPENEEAKEPFDWDQLVVHVVRGGLRAGLLSFGLRGTVMLVFALIKVLRTRKFKGNDLTLAYLSASNLRFGGMFGLWAILYKAVHNSLRLMTPPPVPSERRRSSQRSLEDDSAPGSGTATPRSGYVQLQGKSEEEKAKIKNKQKRRAFMRDPRSKVWHAYVAGAISALAVMVETKDMRITMAQQMFVRGLEGSYNLAHARGHINVPYGSVLVFGLACGQIMYAWINAPDSLPRGYVSWITNASAACKPVTPVHREIQRTGTFDPSVILTYFPDGKIPAPISTSPLRYPNVPANAVNSRGITGKNVREFVQILDRQKRGEKFDYIPCVLLHPWENSHVWSPIDRFVVVTRWILPVYMTLYFVPAVFLRTKSFLKAPLRITLRSLFGSVRSSSFLGAFVVIFQVLFCSYQQLHRFVDQSEFISQVFGESFKEGLKKLLMNQGLMWVAGFMTCLSLFVDDARRRAELAAYVLPKGMESAWSIARQRSWVPFVPGGDLLLTSAGVSMVMGTYAQNPEHLSGLVRRIIYQFVGRN